MPNVKSSFVPRLVGVFAGVLGLAAYLAVVLVFGLLDLAFEQGGKAPMLIAVVGAACAMGGYWAGEAVASRLVGRPAPSAP